MAMQRYEGDSALINVGQTKLDAGDFVPPRVKVVQQMSDEVATKKASAGEFYNTLTGENFGEELRFIPIIPFKQRILLVRSEKRPAIEQALGTELSEGDGLKCRSYDMEQGIGEPGTECGPCPLAQWGEGNKPPLCTETYNIAALTELGDLIFLGFSKSSAKVGKKLFSMTRMSAGAPWSKIYKVTTHAEKNDKGNFFMPDVVVDGPTPSELLPAALQWARELGAMTIDVTPVDEEDGAEAATKDF